MRDALMLGSITASGQQDLSRLDRVWGNRARDLSNMGPWSWRMMPFRVDFGARCAFSGWVLVCGAPFLGSILVRGVWCADFGAVLCSILVRRLRCVA